VGEGKGYEDSRYASLAPARFRVEREELVDFISKCLKGFLEFLRQQSVAVKADRAAGGRLSA
jgi:hypothetical protein